MWHFGIRRLNKNTLVLTEEFDAKKLGVKSKLGVYAEIGILESYTKKELEMLLKDLLIVLKKPLKKTAGKTLSKETLIRLLGDKNGKV